MTAVSTDPRTSGPQDRNVKFIRNSKTISGRLHDEMVMMDMDQGKYFSLNPVATRIWDLLEKARELDELCGLLTEEYEVDSDKCIREVEEHVTEMVNLKLVHVVKIGPVSL
jgi:hypothetical protein